MNRITKSYLRAGFCIAGFLLFIQATAQYAVSGEILDVNYQFGNVIIELKNDSKSRQINVTAHGHFSTSLDWNEIYLFKFRKEGYVTKVIEFSTKLPKGKEVGSIEPYHMPVRLFKTFEGVDTVFFRNPIAKIRYDSELGDFEHDIDYSMKIKYRIDKMREDGVIPEPIVNELPSPKIAEKKAIVQPSEVKTTVGNIDKTTNEELLISFEEITGAPPLKSKYEHGETVEEFELTNRNIKRTIFIYGEQRRVFLSVKHSWGGHFYFIDQAEIGYRCISRDVYEFSIKKYRKKIKTNK
ncbi:hypothetical protein [Carboxylicivirga marina]|uniref:hypothetical protein n=1 Tax=Carboxylicivirga marina TaxID=2800988 RepID=UPI00259553B5|nr:hypothetical protein [uncultured Carboxylicivirga sp.]